MLESLIWLFAIFGLVFTIVGFYKSSIVFSMLGMSIWFVLALFCIDIEIPLVVNNTISVYHYSAHQVSFIFILFALIQLIWVLMLVFGLLGEEERVGP